MSGWRAFRTGLSRTGRYWQVWAILFAVNLLSALLLALLPALNLASGFGHRPAIRQAADGVDAWLLIEKLTSPLTNASLAPGDAEPELSGDLEEAILLALITAAALPWLVWLPGAFLSGGLLLTYAEAPQPFRWRRFLWAGWHWWGAFLVLALIQALVFLVLLLLAVPLVLAASAAGGWPGWVAAAGLALLALLWLVLMECTRILAVLGGTHNILRAFGAALRFILRRPLPVAVLYGLVLLLVGLAHLLYRQGIMPYLPLDWWPVVLLVQQSFILLRLGSRLVRLAGGVALIGAHTGLEPRHPLPGDVVPGAA